MSLRDIQRLLDVSHWFYNQRENLFPAMDKLWDKRHATVDVTVEPPEEDAEEEEGEEPKQKEPSWKLNPEQFRERFRVSCLSFSDTIWPKFILNYIQYLAQYLAINFSSTI